MLMNGGWTQQLMLMCLAKSTRGLYTAASACVGSANQNVEPWHNTYEKARFNIEASALVEAWPAFVNPCAFRAVEGHTGSLGHQVQRGCSLSPNQGRPLPAPEPNDALGVVFQWHQD